MAHCQQSTNNVILKQDMFSKLKAKITHSNSAAFSLCPLCITQNICALCDTCIFRNHILV